MIVLKTLNDLYKKVTGFGGWAIYTFFGSVVCGAILYRLFSLRLPAYLNSTDPYNNVPLGALLFICMLIPTTYTICRLMAYRVYGKELESERTKLNELINDATNFRRSLDVLVLIEEFNSASLEALPKNLKGALKIHKKWRTEQALKRWAI